LLLSTGWGLLFLFLVGAPLVAFAVRPSAVSPSALAQVTLVAAAVMTAAALSASPRYLSVVAGLLVTVAVLALAARDRPWDALRAWRWSTLPATLVLIAVAPCWAYAWSSATGDARITDDTWGLDHWPAQAALPLAVLLISALAAGHPPGWRLPAWSAGTAAAWFAIVCWLEPNLVASVSRPWAAATLLWSVAFIAATHPRPRDNDRGGTSEPGRLPNTDLDPSQRARRPDRPARDDETQRPVFCSTFEVGRSGDRPGRSPWLLRGGDV